MTAGAFSEMAKKPCQGARAEALGTTVATTSATAPPRATQGGGLRIHCTFTKIISKLYHGTVRNMKHVRACITIIPFFNKEYFKVYPGNSGPSGIFYDIVFSHR